jgi:Mg-chelatase subunit ChlD
MARRRISVFSLSILDAMTCGFGAVVLFFMVINASVGLRAGRLTADLQAEVNLLEEEVLEGHENLVELRNSLRENEEQTDAARGLSARVLDELKQIQLELATYDETTLARREHIARLKADIKSLEEEARRLSAATPSEETPGDRLRAFIGDGDRQYLTGLKVGGERILIVVDASASMLGDTLVNIIRRRNLPDEVKIQADKWQRAVSTVDWLTTQIPRESQFQIYTFAETTAPVIPGTEGQWLDGGDRAVLDEAVERMRQVVPGKGTSLYHGLGAAQGLQPRPDNLILLVDGLPTQGKSRPRGKTVSGKQRLRHFERALGELVRGVPVNVILYPMEGDPMAASAYWKLAVATGGSFMSPAEDWP